MHRREWIGVILAGAMSLAFAVAARAQDASAADKEKALGLLESSRRSTRVRTFAREGAKRTPISRVRSATVPKRTP